MYDYEILIAAATPANATAVAVASGAAVAFGAQNARFVFTAIGGNVWVKVGKSTVTGAAATTGNYHFLVPNNQTIQFRLAGGPESVPQFFCAIADVAATLYWYHCGN